MIRTLVVDDDYRVADLHCAYVERVTGFEVAGRAHNGTEALQAVDELRPELVLLDIYLPDISGLEVLRRLREDDHPPVAGSGTGVAGPFDETFHPAGARTENSTGAPRATCEPFAGVR